MSGKGGDILFDTAKKVLADEYPHVAGKFQLTLPDEKFRRVGSSSAIRPWTIFSFSAGERAGSSWMPAAGASLPSGGLPHRL